MGHLHSTCLPLHLEAAFSLVVCFVVGKRDIPSQLVWGEGVEGGRVDTGSLPKQISTSFTDTGPLSESGAHQNGLVQLANLL